MYPSSKGLRAWGVTLALGLLLPLLLLFGVLSACQGSRESMPLPHLEKVISFRGWGPSGKIIAIPNGYAYVANYGSVGVLDGPRLVKNITETWTGNSHLEDIAIHPFNHRVYVTDFYGRRVDVIADTQVFTIIPFPQHRPNLIYIHPTTGYIYIDNGPGAPQTPSEANVTIVSDTQIITHLDSVDLPYVMIANPVDGWVYIGKDGDDWGVERPGWHEALAIVEGAKLITLTRSISPPISNRRIEDIAFHPTTGEMYLLENNQVVYINGQEELRVPYTVTRGNTDQGVLEKVVIDAKRHWAYVTAWQKPPGHVFVFEKDKLLARISVGYDPRGIAIDQTHDYVYIANRYEGTLSIIRGTEVITTLKAHSSLGGGSSYIAVDEPRGYIYVSNAESGDVSVFSFDQPATTPTFWQTYLPWLRR